MKDKLGQELELYDTFVYVSGTNIYTDIVQRITAKRINSSIPPNKIIKIANTTRAHLVNKTPWMKKLLQERELF